MALASFQHGVHPSEHKAPTQGLAVQRMRFVERYVLPLSQHLGAPSRPAVELGQVVKRGQLIAEPGGFVSTSLHAPVRGRVVSIGPQRTPSGAMGTAIEIEADSFDAQQLDLRPPAVAEIDLDALVEGVRAAGIVGLGGAAFPTHVKYRVPDGRRIHTLVINGAECEPWLTCDHRLMLERPRAVIRGVSIVATAMAVDRVLIGVEANKLDAVEALRAAVRSVGSGPPIEVVPCQVKYPQGAEKMLIEALTGVQVPGGKLPLHVGVVVNNVGTMAAVDDWFRRGQPLIERVVTVSGPGVSQPANLMVPLGTSLRVLLEACGGVAPDAALVVMGGPMMGQPAPSLDVPVVKGTSGLLVFRERDLEALEELPCIRCGRCLEACACFLNPSILGRLARKERWEAMAEHNLMDCMECGACSFTCPSRIPLVQQFRVAKAQLRRIAARDKQRGGA
jgi:electron transport complex protein RnfC